MTLDKARKYKEGDEVFQWSTNVDAWFEVNGRRAYCHELFQEMADNGSVEELPMEFVIKFHDDKSLSIYLKDCPVSYVPGFMGDEALRSKKFKCVEVLP